MAIERGLQSTGNLFLTITIFSLGIFAIVPASDIWLIVVIITLMVISLIKIQLDYRLLG